MKKKIEKGKLSFDSKTIIELNSLKTIIGGDTTTDVHTNTSSKRCSSGLCTENRTK